jgi:multiple sugar transport system permease protein
MNKLPFPGLGSFGNRMGEHTPLCAFLRRLPMYLILTAFALMYLEPVLYMISTAFKSARDLTDATAKWIPRDPTLTSMDFAFGAMKVWPTFLPDRSLWENLMRSNLFVSIVTTFVPALVQVFTCAIAGYAFARLNFPCKRLLFVLLLLSYIIPPQTIFMPLTWVFRALGVINNPMSFILPAIFGTGLKGSLFIIIYMQFFKKLPAQLEEAAYIDGASAYKVFFKVMLPLAKPAKITVFLFSMVWHWNETYLTGLFYTRIGTLATALEAIELPENDYSMTLMAVKMAAALIFVLPMLIIYLFTQRNFTESIERTGIVE